MAIVGLTDLINYLKNGELGSFPTDTVPALAVLPHQSHLIYTAKQRTLDKPLILMADSRIPCGIMWVSRDAAGSALMKTR